VFVHANGRPVRPDWLTRRFSKLVAEPGLPPVRLHDLRARHCEYRISGRVDLKVIQHDMGRSSAVTTADTCVTVFHQIAHAAVRAAAQLLLSYARVRMLLEGAPQA
jgi:integrase